MVMKKKIKIFSCRKANMLPNNLENTGTYPLTGATHSLTETPLKLEDTRDTHTRTQYTNTRARLYLCIYVYDQLCNWGIKLTESCDWAENLIKQTNINIVTESFCVHSSLFGRTVRSTNSIGILL